MRDSDLKEAYGNRRDVMLEACRLLREEVLSSLDDVAGTACDFRVIELEDYLSLMQRTGESERDVWCNSADLIVGTVSARTPEGLQRARRVTADLFTINQDGVVDRGKTEWVAICVIPPWAKPASWTESMVLPTRLTIRYLVEGGGADEDAVMLSPFQPLSVALSGGGLRATLFQLGIFVFLAEQNRLKDVREIVSVSGGSILAAHFLKYWPAATSGAAGFRDVAAKLLVVTRSNIRDRVLIPWIWSRLIPWAWVSRRRGRSERLKKEYERIFGPITLGELTGDNRPAVAIVATDAIRQERVALTKSQILRWSIQGDEGGRYPRPSSILASGVELSLAVAASSCFPPVFPRLHLTHNDFGLTYSEFKEDVDLNDGGVVTNLGIEVLVAMRKLGWTEKTLILIADSERPQTKKPGRSVSADIDATGVALSKEARERAKREFGERGVPIAFSDRADNPEGLTHRTETALAGYRTDLDCPSWQEIHGLMLHGAMLARRALGAKLGTVDSASLKKEIAAIIVAAEGPKDLPIPDHRVLGKCGRRPVKRICLHGMAAMLVFITTCVLLVLTVACGAAMMGIDVAGSIDDGVVEYMQRKRWWCAPDREIKLRQSVPDQFYDHVRYRMDSRVFHVDKPIEIPPDAVVVIEPGATLRFSPGASMSVRGTLKAIGTSESPIVFTAIDDTRGWGAIRFIGPASNGSEMQYAEIAFGRGAAANLQRFHDVGYATSAGGGLHIRDSSPRVSHVTVSRCSANVGGGLFVANHSSANDKEHSLMLDRVRIVSCSATGRLPKGGGIAVVETLLECRGCEFADNEASDAIGAIGVGGALYLGIGSRAKLLEGCRLRGNRAAAAGGAVCAFATRNEGGSFRGVSIRGAHIVDNRAKRMGGAVDVYNSQLSIVRCIFEGNTCQIGGGAAGGENDANRGAAGGALHCRYKDKLHLFEPVVIDSNSFRQNSVEDIVDVGRDDAWLNSGGAVCIELHGRADIAFEVVNNEFLKNHAPFGDDVAVEEGIEGVIDKLRGESLFIFRTPFP